jgi:CheY-like chemotaxis protein
MAESSLALPHLLVVEADQSLQLVFQLVLAEMGYISTLASSPDQALRLLDQRPFDLIVTDTFSYTGQEALAPLRPLLALSQPLPVILCTAWPLTEAVVKQEGFAGLVLQPFELDRLITTVAECLKQPWSPAQLRQAEVVKRYVALFAVGDVEAMDSFHPETVRFYPWIASAYPFARPVTGRAAARVYLQELLQYFGGLQTELVHLYACPLGIAARMLLRWHDPSGAPRQQMLAVCLRVTPDGQISQMGLPPPDARLVAQLSTLHGV